MTDLNNYETAFLDPGDTVFIKQEVVPQDYMSEEDEEEAGGYQQNNCDMRGQHYNDDPDFIPEEAGTAEEDSSTVSDEDSSDGEPLLDPSIHRRPPAPAFPALASVPVPSFAPCVIPTFAPVRCEYEDVASDNGDDDSSDDSDGEIKLPMIRVWYPSKMSFADVERSRRSIIKLEHLPREISSRDPGANFSKEELEAFKLPSRPKSKDAQSQTFQYCRPGPKSKTRTPASLVPKSVGQQYNSNVLTCERCGRTFTRPSSLKYHMEHVHIDSPAAVQRAQTQGQYACDTCGKRFMTRSHLITHSETHTGVPLFSCRVAGCNRMFSGRTTRRMHELKCGAPPEPAVLIMDQATNVPVPMVSLPAEGMDYGIVIDGDKILLKRPVQLAKAKPNSILPAPEDEDVGRKVCRYCQHKFVTAAGCRQHEFRHEGVKAFKCTHEGCNAAFSMPISLTEHVRMVHTGETPYKCMFEGCGMAFGRVLTFKHHIRSKHLNTKYPCPTCGKAFTMKGTLDRHVKIHTGIRPHLCQECGKSFMAAFNLRLHSKVHLKSAPKPPSAPRLPGEKKKRDWSRRRPPAVKYDEFGNVIPKEYPYQCTQAGCNKAFMRPWNLEAHAKEKHGVNLTASVGAPTLSAAGSEAVSAPVPPRKRKQGQPQQQPARAAPVASLSDSQFSQQLQPQLQSQYRYGYDPRPGPSSYNHNRLGSGPVNMAMTAPGLDFFGTGGQRYWGAGAGSSSGGSGGGHLGHGLGGHSLI